MSEESVQRYGTDQSEEREKILAFEVEARKLPQIEIPVRHYFSKGLYAREITIPAGAIVTGKIHLFEHLNIISAGVVRIVTEDFNEVVEAPRTLVAMPGVKKVLHAITTTVFTTVHATDITDIDEIERVFVTEDYGDLKLEEQKPCHLLQ